jgi:hypothetical protein
LRSRLVILLASILIFPVVASAQLFAAHASTAVVLAQAAPGPKGGGKTQAATPSPGPPWTYQMARISIVLLLLIIAAVALLYYRLVLARQRGEV